MPKCHQTICLSANSETYCQLQLGHAGAHSIERESPTTNVVAVKSTNERNPIAGYLPGDPNAGENSNGE